MTVSLETDADAGSDQDEEALAGRVLCRANVIHNRAGTPDLVALEGGARWKESAWVPSAPLFIAVASWVTLHLVRAGPYN